VYKYDAWDWQVCRTGYALASGEYDLWDTWFSFRNTGPIPFLDGIAQSKNLYAYAICNPLVYVDPVGKTARRDRADIHNAVESHILHGWPYADPVLTPIGYPCVICVIHWEYTYGSIGHDESMVLEAFVL